MALRLAAVRAIECYDKTLPAACATCGMIGACGMIGGVTGFTMAADAVPRHDDNVFKFSTRALCGGVAGAAAGLVAGSAWPVTAPVAIAYAFRSNARE